MLFSYKSRILDPKSILVRYWGYPAFRPLQEDIIQSVLEGKDTLALLPTGGGKSICFQIPALCLDGICIVVTPLIALMKDQVMNLKKRGIQAVAIHSGMRREEVEVAYDNSLFGNVKFIYISPERLVTEQFRNILQRMNVSLLAVDESHCISQWGYDFRPPYLRIAEIRKYIPGATIIALTATATEEVVIDIQEKLGFASENVFRKSFERENLTYAVIREEDKMGQMIRVMSRISGTAIIYVRNRRKTKEISDFLNKNQISATYYHAGLDSRTRESRQESWIRGQLRVIVATNAFGMGIDKPDVRLVIHMDIPDTLEAYFQEAGRGGRDEKRAYSILLFENADLIRLKENFINSYPEPDEIRKIYKAIGNYLQLAVGSGKDQSFEFDLRDFSRNYNFNSIVVFNALKILEKDGYLFLNEDFGSPSRILVLLKKEDLYRFQVENPRIDPFIKIILRTYTGVFTEFTRISENELSGRTGISRDKILTMLKYLSDLGVISYIPQAEKPSVTFVRERIDHSDLYLAPENYFDRKNAALKRIESVADYATRDTRCRSQILLSYFGELNAKRCGRCDVCRKLNKVDLSEIAFDRIVDSLKSSLSKNPLSLEELVFDIREYREEHIVQVLRWLEDNGKIKKLANKKYQWQKQYRLRI